MNFQPLPGPYSTARCPPVGWLRPTPLPHSPGKDDPSWGKAMFALLTIPHPRAVLAVAGHSSQKAACLAAVFQHEIVSFCSPRAQCCCGCGHSLEAWQMMGMPIAIPVLPFPFLACCKVQKRCSRLGITLLPFCSACCRSPKRRGETNLLGWRRSTDASEQNGASSFSKRNSYPHRSFCH